MLKLIPAVKQLQMKDGTLEKKTLFYCSETLDSRIAAALKKLPFSCDGTPVEIVVNGVSGESYELWIEPSLVRIVADSCAGAFYAIQTLRQIFKHDVIPCLYIKDAPDFPHRGFYHDVTRGKVPTLESLKKLIDDMVCYKLNSLQLYIEHTCELKECSELIASTGYLTNDEIRQLDAYCKENFVDFIPSLSTFGHLYELLQQEKYHHLRVLKDYEPMSNFWNARMIHHTIDPRNPDSLALIKSLIDQYIPLFTSEYFNICCDETFDLNTLSDDPAEVGKLYVEFVKKIIAHVKSRGKKVMMWGDILLKHPETIEELPEDTCYLNWFYRLNPPEENVIRLAQSGRPQIVCPGTTTWNRFCECVDVEENNICLMADYGYKHGAVGVLNTNWGDWGNPCSVELAMYGMVLGAAKAWSVDTQVGDSFDACVNFHLYENENGISYLRQISRLHDRVNWRNFCQNYFYDRIGNCKEFPHAFEDDIDVFQKSCLDVLNKLDSEEHFNEEYRDEMRIAVQGVCLLAELYSGRGGAKVNSVVDVDTWLAAYREKWTQKNKESELCNLEEMFRYCAQNWR